MRCDDARAAVVAQGPLPTAVVDHVAGCAPCHHLLAAACLQLLGTTPAQLAVACPACLADLSGYLDAVHADGAGAAASSYPHVWWHLCTCPDCAETAALTQELMDAERRGEIAPPPRLLRSDP